MKWNINYGLVATAAFMCGIAVDRAVISSTSEKAATKDPLEPNRELSGGESREREMTAHSDRALNRRYEDDLNEDSGSLRQILEDLERGGHMDALSANRILQNAPVGQERRQILEHLAHAWGRQDGRAAVAWAESLEGIDRRGALDSALHGWSDEDPAGATRYVAELPASERNLDFLHEMTRRWAERDRFAAMEWGASQTEPAKYERAMVGVMSSWAEADPAAAANFAATMENPFVKREALEMSARLWANQDAAAALEWAKGLANVDRQLAIESILHGVAEHTPERAAGIYQELTVALPPESRGTEEYGRMAREIASAWSSNSPQEAADWALGLPEPGAARQEAIEAIAEGWLRIDSMAAGEWILQLPEGEVRDAAAERVVDTMLPADPAMAFDWANSLSDEEHRTDLMREVLHRWTGTDRASAQAALESAKISTEQRRELNEVFGGDESE